MNRKMISALCLIAAAGVCAPALAQETGPSTLQSSYMIASDPSSGVRFISIASNGNGTAAAPNEFYTNLFTGNNDYRLVGVPDGMGAYRTPQDIIDGTSTFLVNHEIGNATGIVRAHGNAGAFVSTWRVVTDPSRADFLRVVGGGDLSTTYNMWNGSSWVVNNTANPMSTGMNRFCSADLAPVSAYSWTNPATGQTFGTTERIFLNGEEAGAEGRAMAHIATGPEARQSFQLPSHGRYSWENNVANPHSQQLTIVAGTDDSTPGNLYFYVGQKQATGNTIERAGLTNGTVYGVVVNGGNNTIVAGQRVEDRTNVLGNATTGRVESAAFSLVAMQDQTNRTGAQLQTETDSLRQMNFLRPEDSAWNPSNHNQLFFATTDAFTGNSRLWSMTFTNITQPTLGGQVTMLADGSNASTISGGITSATGATDIRMMDNIAVSRFNQVLIQEDVGNNARLGRLWLYDLASDSMVEIGIPDATRFLAGGSRFLTQDEETSGIIDAWDIIGPGWWLLDMQSHNTISGELAEGGQLMAVFIPQTVPTPAAAAVLGLGGLLAARRRR